MERFEGGGEEVEWLDWVQIGWSFVLQTMAVMCALIALGHCTGRRDLGGCTRLLPSI